MKTIFRSIGLAMLAAVFIAAGSNAVFAQAGCDNLDAITALDAKIRETYPKNSTLKTAIDSGKEFLEKFGTCEALADFNKWLREQIPEWEKKYKRISDAQARSELIKRYDAAINGEKYDDVYAAGKEILAKEPDNVHVMIPMGLFGLGQSYKKNYKYNDDTLTYAKMAIAKLKGGAEGKKDKDGKPILDKAGKQIYSTYDLTKEDAIDELTYVVAYITFVPKNDKKTALPLFYELTQSSGKYKSDPRVYGPIGDYYFEQAMKLRNEIPPMIDKQKTLEKDEDKIKLDAEIEAKIAMFNGYAERAMDAYGRAHSFAKGTTPAEKTFKDNLFKAIQDLYKQRFEKDTGINEFIAATIAKPFPNPTSEVTPISDPKPVTTTTTTTSTAPPTKPTNGKTATATKPKW